METKINFDELTKRYMREFIGISTTEYRVFQWIEKQPEFTDNAKNCGNCCYHSPHLDNNARANQKCDLCKDFNNWNPK